MSGHHLFDWLARSALWHVVGRVIWSAPTLVVVLVAAVAAVWLLRRRSTR